MSLGSSFFESAVSFPESHSALVEAAVLGTRESFRKNRSSQQATFVPRWQAARILSDQNSRMKKTRCRNDPLGCDRSEQRHTIISD
jgi:hypothetical protein